MARQSAPAQGLANLIQELKKHNKLVPAAGYLLPAAGKDAPQQTAGRPFYCFIHRTI